MAGVVVLVNENTAVITAAAVAATAGGGGLRPVPAAELLLEDAKRVQRAVDASPGAL